MRRTIFTLLLLFTSLLGFAQKKTSKDLIRFKDGSQLRGEISEYIRGKSVTILIDEKKRQIHDDEFQSIRDIDFDHYNYFDKIRAVWYEVNFGITTGKSSEFNVAENYPFINGIVTGIGLGSGYQGLSNINVVPLYASFRGDFFHTRVTPFYYTNLGYGIGLKRNDSFFFGEDQKVKGGLLFSIGMGLKIKLKKSYISASMGYRLQRSKTESISTNTFLFNRPPAENRSVEERAFKKLEIKVGIGF